MIYIEFRMTEISNQKRVLGFSSWRVRPTLVEDLGLVLPNPHLVAHSWLWLQFQQPYAFLWFHVNCVHVTHTHVDIVQTYIKKHFLKKLTEGYMQIYSQEKQEKTFFLKIFFSFVWVFSQTYVYVPQAGLRSVKVREFGSPGTGFKESCKMPFEFWGSNPGRLLEEQSVLLITKQSLKPKPFLLY